MRQDAEMLAGRRLADPQLCGDEDAAHAVLHQVAIHLRREVLARALQPFQNLQPLRIGERTQTNVNIHIDN